MPRLSSFVPVLAVLCAFWIAAPDGQTDYRIYAGSTHAHTSFTWSHGEHLATNGCAGILTYAKSATRNLHLWADGYVKPGAGCPAIFVINGSQIHAPGVTVRPDWTAVQGPPSMHFAAARAAGYDFYSATDHSQEAGLQPTTVESADWTATKNQAAAASDDRFAGLAGFEYSENDGPGGTGHINVFNSADLVNALVPGVDLPYLYRWLPEARPHGAGPVVASFNHPGPDQYGNWAGRDARVTDVIATLEVINSNTEIFYEGFVRALDHGWKVSPVAGNDNHGLTAITRHDSRTFVLARSLSQASILDAMKNRRTYAALDRNLQCRYLVNGAIMGSTLPGGSRFRFDVTVEDPDTGDASDRITRIEIVKDGGIVVDTYTPTPTHSVRWTTTIEDITSTYFFLRIWSAGGADSPNANAAEPVAWLAPVWTGRSGASSTGPLPPDQRPMTSSSSISKMSAAPPGIPGAPLSP